ncbi:MAG: hypothetical protein EBY80_01940 [Actinobacteria bacterium]|nr:hypothetical protein [Actinomycetota bacterium]
MRAPYRDALFVRPCVVALDRKRKRAPRVLPVSQRSARGVSRSRIHQYAISGCYPSFAHLIRPSELPPAGELPFPAPTHGCPVAGSGPPRRFPVGLEWILSRDDDSSGRADRSEFPQFVQR